MKINKFGGDITEILAKKALSSMRRYMDRSSTTEYSNNDYPLYRFPSPNTIIFRPWVVLGVGQ